MHRSLILNALFYVFCAFSGFLFYSLVLKNDIVHGPLAEEFVKYIYFDPVTERYYKFNVKMYLCPPSLRRNITPSVDKSVDKQSSTEDQ